MMRGQTKMALTEYHENGEPPGLFLYAVLTNNLLEACRRASHNDEQELPEVVKYIYNNFVIGSWGNSELVAQWITNGGRTGIHAELLPPHVSSLAV